MPLTEVKCTNCGAVLKAEAAKDAAVCDFCGSAFIVEKAINNYNTTNNISAQVVNVYGGQSSDFEIQAGKLIKYKGAAREVIIPDGVNIIGAGAFAGCSGLTSIDIPNSVTYIGSGAFHYCTGLTGINIPNSVTHVGSWAFFGCSGLTSIDIPDSVEHLGRHAFKNCTNLQAASIDRGLKKQWEN